MNLFDAETWLKFFFPTVDTPPVDPPALPIGFALYKNGTEKRLYIYFFGDWTAFPTFDSAVLDNFVTLDGDEVVDGEKEFLKIPILPDSNPTTDNQAARKEYVDDKFSLLPTFVMTPSNVLRVSADTAGGPIRTNGSWLIKKNIKTTLGGTLRVKFDAKTLGISETAYAQIYKNDTAVGTLRTLFNPGSGDGFTTYEEDFSVAVNDEIKLKVMSEDENHVSWRNFRFYYDKVIGDFGGNPTDYEIIQND